MKKKDNIIKRAKVITSAKVHGTNEVRKVFYVRREMLYDKNGRICPTPLELGIMLSDAMLERDEDAVAGICWDALNFVHNGNVPKDWLGGWKEAGPTPIAV